MSACCSGGFPSPEGGNLRILGTMSGPDRQRGVILIVVSGIAVLLVFTAMLLLQYGLFAARGGSAKVSGAQARLAALSGMDYAASRLVGGVYPRWSTVPLDRGDDWKSREGPAAQLEQPRNPSFSHGEAWSEGIADGRYDGSDAFLPAVHDRDMDDAHSAWSGRMRGGRSALDLRFSLRIEAGESKIPLNGGFLDGLNRNGGTVIDCRDLAFGYHAGLAHALNNLGALLFPDGSFRRADAPAGDPSAMDGEKIQVCWVGTDLIRNRPVGGYRSPGEVSATLLAVGYAPDQVAAILPYLDLGPYPGAPDRGGYAGSDSSRSIPYVPVSFSAASPLVLRSIWAYLGAPVITSECSWSDPAWDLPFRRSGASNLPYELTASKSPGMPWPAMYWMTVWIWPDEAEQLADFADDLRVQGVHSWSEFRSRLIDESQSRFPAELAALDLNADGDSDPATNPGWAQRAWMKAKADLAYAIASPDAPAMVPVPAIAWSGGYDAYPGALDPGTQPLVPLWAGWIGETRFPVYPATAYDASLIQTNFPYQWMATLPGGLDGAKSPAIRPLGLSMLPPTRFHVRCASVAGEHPRAATDAVSALLWAGIGLDLASQEDFENLQGSAWLERVGIAVLDPDPKDRRARRIDGGRLYPSVKSYPRFNASRIPGKPFSSWFGGLALADREAGTNGAKHYWPFTEDFDGVASDLFPAEPSGGNALSISGSNDLGPGASASWWANRMTFTTSGYLALWVPSSSTVEYVSEASIEGWVVPLPYRIGSTAFPEIRFSGQTVNPGNTGQACSMGIFSERRFASLKTVRFTVTLNGWAYKSSLPAEWLNRSYLVDVPDYDPVTKETQTGHYHVALTLMQIPGPKTRFRFYVNGVKRKEWDYPDTADPAKMGAMQKASWLQLSLGAADEVRLYDRAIDSDVDGLYAQGRFVAPAAPATADPASLLVAGPAEPPNPAYRSPVFRLGTGGRVIQGGWSGFSSPEMDGKVGMRCTAIGLASDGGVVASAPLGGPAAATDLSAIPPFHDFRYAVEFFSRTGGSAGPLYDTPVLESAWFTLLRRGIAPGWSAWTGR